MSKDIAFNPDNWYYDPPENTPNFGGRPASPYMQKIFEDIAFNAFGKPGLDKLHKSWEVACAS